TGRSVHRASPGQSLTGGRAFWSASAMAHHGGVERCVVFSGGAAAAARQRAITSIAGIRIFVWPGKQQIVSSTRRTRPSAIQFGSRLGLFQWERVDET